MSLAREITSRLGGEWRGDHGAVPGPNHSAHDRSVTVRDNDAGDDVVLHSFAGDDWKAIKDHWRRNGILPDRSTGTASAKLKRGAVVASFDYRRADGSTAYRINRIEPGRDGRRKDFAVYHPDQRGGWAKGLNGFEPIPYRLPELLAAHSDSPLFIVEGEKKVDALAAIGLVATCNPFGAGKWPASFAQHLAGREVFILPDNDKPGAAHAADVMSKLAAVALSVSVVDLPGLADKGDVCDWLAAGGSAMALVDLCQSAPVAEPLTSAPPPPRLPIICPSAWVGIDAPHREWLIDGWLARGSAAYLTGDGGVGKSLLTQQLATCLATGCDFLGLPVAGSVALYVTCEDDIHELHRRQAAINAGLGITMAQLEGRLFLSSLKGELGNEIGTFDSDNRLKLSTRYDDLESTAKTIGARFVALDNVAQTFAGNENIRNQVAAYCNVMDRLAMAIDGSVLFLGHPSKAGAEFSGSTGWEAHVRQRLFIDWADAGDGVGGDRDARLLKKSKANYSQSGNEVAFRWHAGAFILEADMPFDPERVDAATTAAAGENETFLTCLAVMTEQRRAVSISANAGNYAPKMFAHMPEAKRMAAPAFAAAMERLLRLGRVENATAERPLWRGPDRKPVIGLRLKVAE